MLSITAFVVATSLSPFSAPAPELDVAAMFPPPKEGFTIVADRDHNKSMKLDQVLDEFSRVTGIAIQTTRETNGVLKQVSPGLNQSILVPASEVYRIVEALLIANDFTIARLSNEEPRIWNVSSLQASVGRGGSSSRNSALIVNEKELLLLADHAATLVTTTIDLPKTDVRTLSNSMRTMFTDANTQQIIPVGANSLIITGFAPNVAGLTRILKVIDELSPGDPSAQPPSVEVRPVKAGK